ncbi:Coenzyme F420 hydrogenase/dehydrogenase, beta subunit C-terminal domain [Parabacteroides sp. ZJ-118]|uniref:Coenzyme F420 hydrogenase/dehydrogenase, beta subunit C-terminal domain n=1 Tax=Parabacteroides sp. ZJ-118 TaxID=2709398 RepID=UPI0013ECBD5D|nr:Coenzyme F420 hydrogenase/dehydrogenase, beta subunit C-terminal domain [Parabacteroides sp. ZJ-118]
MNIDDKSQIRPCTSCQMCGAVCPVDAITIRLDDNGFYRPQIDINKCIDCGLCVKSCYKFDHSISKSDLANKKIVAAWAKNPEIVESTTSGGIADVLARKFIDEGYDCVGVAYNTDDNVAEGKIASSHEEILSFRGSKYIQSYSVDAFKELVKTSKDKRFAVFGLPCQIYAIDRYLTNRKLRDNHILIDLYCHGCPSINVWEKYINDIKTKLRAKKILSVNFRSKVRGWGSFYVVVVVVEDVNGNRRKYISPKIKDEFYEMFFSDLVLNDSCQDCMLRGTLEYTDIRLGDFWGKSYINNHTGVSGVTISTPRGQKIFEGIQGEVNFERQEFSNFIPYQSYGRDYSVNKEIRCELLRLVSSPSTPLSQCLKYYNRTLPIKTRIFAIIKNLIKLLPISVISRTKSILYSIRSLGCKRPSTA